MSKKSDGEKERWLGVSEVSELTGVPRRTVQRWMKIKFFPSVRQVGPFENSAYKVLESDVMKYIEKYGVRDDD